MKPRFKYEKQKKDLNFLFLIPKNKVSLTNSSEDYLSSFFKDTLKTVLKTSKKVCDVIFFHM